jgi:sarcosine oxidase subunit alpha
MSNPSGGSIHVVINGQRVDVSAGITAAAALLNSGESSFRSSVSGEARGPVCGMGVCYECRVTIDGVAHQRACLRVVADGMRIDTAAVDVR